MKKLFDAADAYVAQSDWTDFAMVKLCLGALGVALGVSLPEKHKKTALAASGVVFAATYVPLMARFFRAAQNAAKSSDDVRNSH